jgi:glycosyl transferase family 25
MKIYVINLPQSRERRENILRECARFDLEPEIFPAVDGRKLTGEQLRELVYEPAKDVLTPGEIGASLSHLKIYEKMLAEDIPLALVLEDAAVFKLDPRPLLAELAALPADLPRVYQLSHSASEYIRNRVIDVAGFKFYQLVDSIGAYGYVLTKKAAERMASFLIPVRMVPDNWKYLIVNEIVEVMVCRERIVALHPDSYASSSIEKEHLEAVGSRRRNQYNRRIRRQKPLPEMAEILALEVSGKAMAGLGENRRMKIGFRRLPE